MSSILVYVGEFVGSSPLGRKALTGLAPVFYPLHAGTNVPIGQIVGRTFPSSEWLTLPSISKQQVSAVQKFMDPNLSWIEMPPGGWVDGEFHDAGESLKEHAYAIYVKPARDAKGIRIVSKSYPSPAK